MKEPVTVSSVGVFNSSVLSIVLGRLKAFRELLWNYLLSA